MRGIAIAVLMVLAASGAARADSEELGRALALTPDAAGGAEVYGLCSNCHKADGWGHEDGTFPAIAGQHRKVIIKQLADIRAGNRDAPTMYPFADPQVIGGAQAIADVAEYISALPPNPTPGTGPGTGLDHGGKLYQEHCAMCHGADGAGNNEAFFPRLAGQHFNYLKTQLTWIRDGRRKNANWAMVAQLKGFDEEEIVHVADYISRLPSN